MRQAHSQSVAPVTSTHTTDEKTAQNIITVAAQLKGRRTVARTAAKLRTEEAALKGQIRDFLEEHRPRYFTEEQVAAALGASDPGADLFRILCAMSDGEGVDIHVTGGKWKYCAAVSPGVPLPELDPALVSYVRYVYREGRRLGYIDRRWNLACWMADAIYERAYHLEHVGLGKRRTGEGFTFDRECTTVHHGEIDRLLYFYQQGRP